MTRPTDFERFHALLTANAAAGYEPWYFRVAKSAKHPDTSYGSWKDESSQLTFDEALHWLQNGGNVGIAGTDSDRLVNVDIDDDEQTQVEDLKPSLLAKSRSREGYHAFYFAADGEDIPNIPTDNAGEVRTEWQYVLAPGSHVDTDPDDVPDDERDDAGYYTVENDRTPTTLAFEDLPEVFVQTYEDNQEARDKAQSSVDDYNVPDNPSNSSALFDISARDVVSKEGGDTDPTERWASLFHDSETSANMSLSSKGLLHCFRHNVAHNGLQALAVLSGYIPSGNTACERIGTPHSNSGGSPPSMKGDDAAIWHAWRYAKDNGYLPDDDPVPYRAVCHLATEMGIADSDEIPARGEYDPDSARLPDYAYNAALSAIENKHGLTTGRSRVDPDDGQPALSPTAEALADDEVDPKPAGTDEQPATDGGAGQSPDDNPEGTTAEEDTPPTPDEQLRQELVNRVVIPLDPPEDSGVDEITHKVAHHRTAEILQKYLSFVSPSEKTIRWRETMYIYVDEHIVGKGNHNDAGVYEVGGRRELERIINSELGPVANNSFVRETADKIRRLTYTRAYELEPTASKLVCGNGVLDLTTGDLEDYDPEQYHRTKVRHDWNPDAQCPRIDEFLHSVVDDKDVDTVYRFIAHALYKGYPESKAAMFLGDGQNGKSTLMELITEFLGKRNVSNRSLTDILENEWAAYDLCGRLANISGDISDQHHDTMGVFKNLTGGDLVDADVKFEMPVKFQNHATMFFAANDIPVMNDDSKGNWRRWCLINFPNDFSKDTDEHIPKRQLMEELTTTEEMQGLFARCVEEIQAWYDGREWFPDTNGWQETRTAMRKAAEPVFAFAHDCLEPVDYGQQEKTDIRKAYQKYAKENSLPNLTDEVLGRKLNGLSGFDIGSARPRHTTGGRGHTYTGVMLNEKGMEYVPDSTLDAQVVITGTIEEMGGKAHAEELRETLVHVFGVDDNRVPDLITSQVEQGHIYERPENGELFYETNR